MSYADSLLASGERIVRRERQHWFVLIWQARFAILGVILGVVLLILSQQLDTSGSTGTLRSILGLVTFLAVILGLLYLGWAYLRYLNEEYVITTRRIIHGEGVINKKATDSSLEKINDAVLTQSLWGRIFGFGDLDVLTASESGIERLRMLVDALDFKKSMLEAKHELEMELTRPVMPPLRSTSSTTMSEISSQGPGGGTAVAAPPALPPAPAAPPRAMSADEVTKALGQLADLRDRGAITPEEFEAKKSELLARL
jgi:hypothetical protein